MRGTAWVCALLCIGAIFGTGRASAQQQITSMTVPVVAVDNPRQLVSLNVVDPSGAPVGDVVMVKTGSDGRASRVLVKLSTPEGLGRVAAVRPERLYFDRREDRIVAQFSAAELTQLAETATVPSGVDTSRSSGMMPMRPEPSSGDSQVVRPVGPPMGY